MKTFVKIFVLGLLFIPYVLTYTASAQTKQVSKTEVDRDIEKETLQKKGINIIYDSKSVNTAPKQSAPPNEQNNDQLDSMISNVRKVVLSWNRDNDTSIVNEVLNDHDFVRRIKRYPGPIYYTFKQASSPLITLWWPLDRTLNLTSHTRFLQFVIITEREYFKKKLVYSPDNLAAFYQLNQLGAFSTSGETISEFQLGKTQNYVTLQSLFIDMDKFNRYQERVGIFDPIHERNLSLIADQSQFISSKEFSEYRFSETSRRILKGINIYHDNDLFFLAGKNQDQNYTGAFRIELTTDLLKIRFFSNLFLKQTWFDWLNNTKFLGITQTAAYFARGVRRLRIDKLSYQSLFYGLEVYTPYLRFDGEGIPLTMGGSRYPVLDLENGLYPKGGRLMKDVGQQYDRPFASLVYFGRAKYRMNKIGTVRTKGEFSLGKIGGSFGEVFQSSLHRDITIASPHPAGWENQIANGGRLTINVSQNIEFMLVSKEGDVFNHREMKKYETQIDNPPANQEKYHDRRFWPRVLNLSGSVEGRMGHQMTYVGGGLMLSTINFKDKSGTEMMLNRPGKRSNLYVSVGGKYRYMKHNSTLEGFGVFKTNESDNLGIPNELISKYKITENIERNLFFGDFNIGVRTVKTVMYFGLTVQSREFYAEKFIRDPQLLKENLFNTQKRYGFGRIGVNFIL